MRKLYRRKWNPSFDKEAVLKQYVKRFPSVKLKVLQEWVDRYYS